MAIRGYYLGCPGWGMKTWIGRLFPPGTRTTDFLARYAEVFNTVEGNTSNAVRLEQRGLQYVVLAARVVAAG